MNRRQYEIEMHQSEYDMELEQICMNREHRRRNEKKKRLERSSDELYSNQNISQILL